MASKSPVHKRIKLDPSASPSPSRDAEGPRKGNEADERDISRSSVPLGVGEAETGLADAMEAEEDEDEDHCVICLHHVRDRTVLPCAHDRLCFECILVWTAQSRKCPLCNAPIGPFLIHNLRSKYDYSKYYLQPLRTSSPPNVSAPLLRGGSTPRGRGRGRALAARWGTRTRNRSASRERAEMEDELELAIERRRWVYRHGVYAKHVASNPYSRYRPAPTPAQIAASADLISRSTIFVRRELRVWVNLDVEFLATFILSLMKTLDLRSESAVKLLAEFLDMDTPYHVGNPSERSEGRFTNAEHFSHELYSYLRSPFRDLAAYDSAVQYDTPSHVPPAPSQPPTERRRWDPHSSTRAERSSRRRRSSPSPLSRSPRDAYSRSPSPVYSDSNDEHWRYGPPPPPRSASGSRSRLEATSRTNTNSWGPEVDRKGKGKEFVDFRVGGGRYIREDDRARQARPAGRSRRRSRSSGHSPVQPGRHRASLVHRGGHSRRSPSNTSDFSREQRDSLDNGQGVPDSPLASQLPSRASDHANGKGKAVGGVVTGEGSTPNGGGPSTDTEPHPVTSNATWGISIKGQAKYISETRDLPREELHLPRESNRDETTIATRKRTRNPSSLDVLHAHLGHRPVTREIKPKNATSSGLAVDVAAVQPQNAANISETLQGDSPSVRPEGETHRLSLSSRLGDHLPSATLPSQSPPTSQRSAREIMARTRAKLARIRADPSLNPLADVVSDVTSVSLPSNGAMGGSSANLDLRARLMARLDEEKRQAATQPHGGQRSPHDDQPISKDLHDDRLTSPEGDTIEPSNDDGKAIDISSESQQAEVKLRAQALLRVRLAAEKRKKEVRSEEGPTMSREEALRAKLLSRRS